MSVLVISRLDNEHSDDVEIELCSRGVKVERINVDEFEFKPIVVGFRLINGIMVPTKEFKSVFVHHPVIEDPSNVGVDELDKKLFISSWYNWLGWLEEECANSIWVNQPSSTSKTMIIPHQLRIAKKHGLTVPATCFTNDISTLKNFKDDHGVVVIKPGNLRGLRLKGKRMLTTLVDMECMDAETLSFSPCLFQEYICKAYELRVHVIKDCVLTCRINSQVATSTRTDWRRYSIAETPHFEHQLDTSVTKAVIEITHELGLKFGIIDLIVTPNGDHVFLECNAQGHWKWIQQLTGLKITQTVCDLLLSQ